MKNKSSKAKSFESDFRRRQQILKISAAGKKMFLC